MLGSVPTTSKTPLNAKRVSEDPMTEPDKLQWRSDFGWSPHSPATPADPKSGLVVHYDSADQRLASKPHSECVAYWKRTRSFHTGPSRGWADIGYSFMACAHGYVMEGRGLFRTQAAQPGGNTSHYSVTLATGPTDEITDAQINAVRQLRRWLMEPATSIAGTVLGHRDFIPTSCPGNKAYALVKDGTFTKAPTNVNTTEDEVPIHSRHEKREPQTLERGEWVSLEFNERHDGSTGGIYSVVGVPAEEKPAGFYDISVGVVLEDVTPGAEVQIRATEYEADGKGGWQIARNRPLHSPVHVGGKAHFVYSWKSHKAKDRRVRFRIAQFGDGPATITSATSETFFWVK